MLFISLFVCGCVAWFISTILAGGAATLLIPIVSFLIGAQLVAPVLSIAALLANPSRTLLFRHEIDWQVARYLIPGTVIGAVMGAWSLTSADIEVIQLVLGIFLIIYVAHELLEIKRISFKLPLPAFFPLGAAVAFLSGLVGATGPVYNPFLLSYGLVKEQLVATKAINSLILQLTKIISYGSFGLLTLEVGLYGGAIGLGAITGVILGRKQLLKINVEQFKRYALLFMLISGIIMVIKAI